MSICVSIDGRLTAAEEASVPVLSRGFLYGDSVYDVVRTVAGRPFALVEHLDRLERSARRIDLPAPPREVVEAAVADTLAAWRRADGAGEARVRVVVTRGASRSWDLDPASCDESHLVVIVTPLGAPPPELYERGAAVEVVSVTRNSTTAIDPAIKSGNYLNNVLALREARRRRPEAHEAIMCAPGGSVAEATTCNVFAVVAGELRTPAVEVGILDGITRAKVIALARAHDLPCREVGHMSPDELRAADEVFLSSTVRGVLPVTRIDGRAVGAGLPGPITRRVMDLYDALMRAG
jgi:branched-chain amino acid aminotransferase